ncbi:recombinase family protein [Streptomyces sp. NPDC007971]|uniref:recombinase family protein n=1 Tax=Streptomyces sp. NPDC007971 TaxID=3364799 RepID=UPI0036E003E5
MIEEKRVAVYTRQGRRGPEDLALQEQDCTEWAKKRGMEVAHVYQSTGSDDQFLDLLNDIAAGRFDAVVASKTNRFSQRTAKVVALAETARNHGVAVHVVEWDDLDLTSSMGKLSLHTLGAFEDLEIEQARAEKEVRESWDKRR